MKHKSIDVTCVHCNKEVQIPVGQLTQEGIERYTCEACSEVVLERRVEAHENTKNGRQLLID